MKQNNSRGHFRPRSNGRQNRGNSSFVVGVNSVMDSNGPCGRVKGTALQIMERYLAAAKDANSSDDRVLGENLMQHAEHYFRTYMQASVLESQRRQDEQIIPPSEMATLTEAAVQRQETESGFMPERTTGAGKPRRFIRNVQEDLDSKREEATETGESVQKLVSDNADESDNIIAMDLSFPDVSKLGQPRTVQDKPAALPAKRGRKPKAVKPVAEALSEVEQIQENGGKTSTLKLKSSVS